ncbi:structural cement protein Gp24 [Rhizobium phaseoli]|uniref:structural cement protein Gp24 n=1 Tax=Rhizobium phaseoli TaxID=396 RepID=UPI00037F488E|nr:hypothetical protein [Rhizobium phaseoli]
MATYQTTYPTAIPNGYAGMIANGETSNRISRTVEDATAIGFGVPVWRGAGDHGVTITPAAGKLMGITIANYAAPPVQATGVQADSYPQYSTAGILTRGVIWVNAAVAVADGDQAYATAAGAITNVSSGNTILPGWFFDDTSSGAGLVRLAYRA